MKLLVHMGLHKTGSTYLQHLLNDNHAALAHAGFWYAPQSGYPAHHEAARRLQVADGAVLAEMVLAARRRGCHTVILSSENLEGGLHDPRPSAAVAKTARNCGVTHVEWHVVLRQPGAVFASLFAQLQHHIYADSTQMFYDCLRRGSLFFDRPLPEDETPYWYYSFDQARDLDRFAQRLCHLGAHDLIAHDYADATPFPGWAMLPDTARAALTILPGASARNARMSEDEVALGYIQRVFGALPDAADQARIMDVFIASLRASLAAVASYAPLIEERFIASHRDALARHGRTLAG